MKNTSLLLLLACLLCLVTAIGCGGSMRAATGTAIGCNANDVELFNPEEADGQETWIARCRGNRHEYNCVRPESSDQVTCEPISAN